MDSAKIEVGELLYQAVVRFTEITEYGVPLETILSGEAAPPAEGARFDVHFKGSCEGPRLRGAIKGVDYLHMRADGRAALHVHAQITTADGANISFFTDGVGGFEPGAHEARLKENASFHTSSPAYAWLNKVQAWAQGVVELEKGEIRIKAYAA
jgi:hypothetical protein